MLTVIYGVPTAGKTYTLEKLIEILGVTKKTDNHKKVFLVDTDDILARVTMATTELGYRINDFDRFWDFWKNAPSNVHERGENIVRNVVEAYRVADEHYIVFTNFLTIKPDIAFKRTTSSLANIWKTREAEKNSKRTIPRDISTLPDWVKNYCPVAYQPSCTQIILGEGEYMFDYIDDIKNLLEDRDPNCHVSDDYDDLESALSPISHASEEDPIIFKCNFLVYPSKEGYLC